MTEKELRELLKKAGQLLSMVRCPDDDCDNRGSIAVMVSGSRQIGDDEWEQTQEWEQQQCQFCHEREIINEISNIK